MAATPRGVVRLQHPASESHNPLCPASRRLKSETKEWAGGASMGLIDSMSFRYGIEIYSLLDR